LCRLEVTSLGAHPQAVLEWLVTAKLLGAA
jgi:hypothetical protein